MNILLLCEGDAETPAPWSGIAQQVVRALRSRGHDVQCGDVDLKGLRRWSHAARTFDYDRRRWGVKYRLSDSCYLARSRNAAQRIASAGEEVQLILQVGATFRPNGRGSIPYVLFCDSNIRVAERARSSKQSPAVWLRDSELRRVVAREERIYREAAAIFTISEQLRQSFIEDFGIPRERVLSVYAGPNLETDVHAVSETRDSDPPTVLFVGAQFERKGGDVLLEAFARVRRHIPDARLVVIGPDRQIDQPGVHCLGYLDKRDPDAKARIAAEYAQADLFCLPTRFEPFGIVFLEAMHFGLPCIGAATGAVPEMIEHGVTGFLVPPDDVSTLAERLLELLLDRQRARAMGEAARARARSRFTWETVATRMSERMHSIISGPAPLSEHPEAVPS